MAVRAGSKTADLSLLWREYQQTGTDTLRNQLVEAHLWVVRNVALGLMSKSFAKFLGLEEIKAAGNLGLIHAVEGYDIDLGNKFDTYAVPRIRGAILDWLRDLDWLPRKARSNAKLYAKAVEALQSTAGNDPTLAQVANYLHVSLETVQALRDDAQGAATHFNQGRDRIREDGEKAVGMLVLDQLPDRQSSTPLGLLTKNDGFNELIGCLNDQEQIILTLYYRDDFTMLNIGIVLGLSESRISQMHDGALLKIKDSFL